jgi:hypothetical protein
VDGHFNIPCKFPIRCINSDRRRVCLRRIKQTSNNLFTHVLGLSGPLDFRASANGLLLRSTRKKIQQSWRCSALMQRLVSGIRSGQPYPGFSNIVNSATRDNSTQAAWLTCPLNKLRTHRQSRRCPPPPLPLHPLCPSSPPSLAPSNSSGPSENQHNV